MGMDTVGAQTRTHTLQSKCKNFLPSTFSLSPSRAHINKRANRNFYRTRACAKELAIFEVSRRKIDGAHYL